MAARVNLRTTDADLARWLLRKCAAGPESMRFAAWRGRLHAKWSRTNFMKSWLAFAGGLACGVAAMVATSPARPPAPEASLALKLSTQAGGGLSSS